MILNGPEAFAGFAALGLAIVGLVVLARSYLRGTRQIKTMARELQDAQRIARVGTVRWDFVRDEVRWSDEYARLLGLEPGGRMSGMEFQGMLLPEYEPRVVESERRALEVSMRTGRPERREIIYKVRSRDGRIMEVEALSELLADSEGKPLLLVSTVRDITEQARQRRDLRKSERNLAAALRVAQLGWFRQDLGSGDISWSEGLYTALGREPGAHAVAVEALVPEEDLTELRADMISLYEPRDPNGRRSKVLDTRLRRADGSLMNARIAFEASYDATGKVDVLSGVIRDITEDVTREAELREAVSEAENANKAKSEFLAVISHELRTPMNGVLGMLGALEETELDTEQREQLHVARTSANSLLVILNDILDAAKIEAGRLEFEEEPFELNALIRSVIHLYQQKAQETGVRLDSRIDAGIPPWVSSDSGRIRQVLSNLVSNALKFTEHGSVMLEVHSIEPQDGEELRLRFCVVDTGTGIPKEHQDKVFGKFEQLGASYSKRFAGTGLGLAISQSLAELMGGEMGFESTEGEGSSFWMDVPVGLSENLTKEQPGKDDKVRLPKMRILVAEDNSTNQIVARSMLERFGQTPDLVIDGAEAVEAVKKFDYDMILMDVSMPNMDGTTATRLIREMGGDEANIPIIALTAHVGADKQAFYRNAGFNEVLTKPLLRPQLAQVLERWKGYALSRAAAEEGGTLPEAAIPAPAPVAAPEPVRAPAPTPEGAKRECFVESEALKARITEMREEFGDTIVPTMLNAALSDLDRHLGAFSRAMESDPADVEAETWRRAFHSVVGIAGTLGCTGLSARSRALEQMGDAWGQAPEEVRRLHKDLGLMRDQVVILMSGEDGAEAPQNATASGV
ncbi:response regulator [Pseudooceanicola sp. CBS1P-1]|uniref:Sensory/regulatory protein RpfC n=1 Tax=Pseudooceanicola albus TaxID=2692189 RepID=A0A6L7G7C8_9RHOB|nr:MULTISPECIES: PAS domain-containing hybrid sensor histidine kinase/response regulator [Pseudooceanicola]MBT9383022.1 response regulator [Pseudooceanicola endophyticus]MXN19210.1 response regulator [Pseudooceanicola albus]